MSEVDRETKTAWQRRKPKVYGQACDLRDKLRSILGGKCKKCGASDDLEFHHPHGRNWEPRKTNLRHRMRRYWRDFSNDNLQLLCSVCNGSDGGLRGYWQRKVTKKSRRRVRRSGLRGPGLRTGTLDSPSHA